MTPIRFATGALFCLTFLSLGCHAEVSQETNQQHQFMPEELKHIRFSGGDGTSCEDAVKIQNASNNAEGIGAENAWISASFPSPKIISKAVRRLDGKVFEIVTLQSVDSTERPVCFDISAFFGVW